MIHSSLVPISCLGQSVSGGGGGKLVSEAEQDGGKNGQLDSSVHSTGLFTEIGID